MTYGFFFFLRTDGCVPDLGKAICVIGEVIALVVEPVERDVADLASRGLGDRETGGSWIGLMRNALDSRVVTRFPGENLDLT